jgi:hypothetical protein
MSISTSLQPDPQLHEWKLRNFFIYHLNHAPSFKQKIEGVREQWVALVAEDPSLSPVTDFRDLPASSDPNDRLNRYIFEVRRVVTDELRCRSRGVAPFWICQAVHGAASGSDMGARLRMDPVLWVGDLRMVVSTMGWAAVQPSINGVGLSGGEEFEGDVNAPFRLWKKLRKAAHEGIDLLIETIREDQELAVSNWPRMYEKGLKTKTFETMPKLVAWLVEREEMFAGDRSATNTLLHELSFDPPSISKKFE